jgi:hypothetical protein
VRSLVFNLSRNPVVVQDLRSCSNLMSSLSSRLDNGRRSCSKSMLCIFVAGSGSATVVSTPAETTVAQPTPAKLVATACGVASCFSEAVALPKGVGMGYC